MKCLSKITDKNMMLIMILPDKLNIQEISIFSTESGYELKEVAHSSHEKLAANKMNVLNDI